MRRLAAAVAGGWSLGLLARRFAGLELDRPASGGARDGPLVTAVVPARDEERAIGSTLRALSAQRYRSLRIVAVDDCSSDSTGAEIARAAAEDARIVAVAGAPPPAGWLGKPWALAQGVAAVEAVEGEWLLFCDADVELAGDAVADALGLALADGSGGCTLLPLLRCEGFWERTVQPTAALLIGVFLAPPRLARRQSSPVAFAAGAFILVERRLYERAGGHAAVRDRVADDLALALAVKRAGGALTLALGDRLVSVRMYHGHAELWRGWRKNAAYGLPGGAPAALAGSLVLATGALVPPLAVALGLARRDRGLASAGLIALAAMLRLRDQVGAGVESPRGYVAGAPLGLVWIAAVMACSAFDRLRGGSRWRGRRYPFAR